MANNELTTTEKGKKGANSRKTGQNKAKTSQNMANPGANRSNPVVNAENEFGLRTLSALLSRLQLANIAGLQFDGARDLYSVFGYKKQLEPHHFLIKYQRQDIASRVVDAPPSATWTHPPLMEGLGEIGVRLTEINNKVNLWNAMYRADRLARLNPFSLLLFGFDDSGNMERKVRRASELLYVRPIGSRQVAELTYNKDKKDPRFGLPEMYRIAFDDPQKKSASGTTTRVGGLSEMMVHHSRVVHVVEDPLEDPVFSTPIMEKVYNLLDDLLKIVGGTAETYWLTGNRGMQANIDKEMDIDPEDAQALSDEIDEYHHQLRRFIRTRGVELNVLDSTVPTPTAAFDMIMSLISGTTGIPKRILLGSEAGQLASEQDRANWAERIEERRKLYCDPYILNPTLALLQSVGLVPEGSVQWEWPSAFIQNPLEEGQTMAQKARAIGNISRQTGNQTPMQLVSRPEARAILGYKDDLSDSDLYVPTDYQLPDTPAGQAAQDEEEDVADERAEDTRTS